jgi:class 3 adenylate cyclase
VIQRLADSREAALDRLELEWGAASTGVAIWAPSLVNDEEASRAYLRLTRAALSPGAARSFMELGAKMDWSDLIPKVAVPTLVMHRAGDVAVPVSRGRELAEQIPGARFIELPGLDHLMWAGDADAVVEQVEGFIRTLEQIPEEATHGPSLASVLFTDIVGSTDRASELGNRRWKELLERHHATVRGCLSRHGGKEIDTAGDGFFATFEGPARAVRCAQDIHDSVAVIGLQLRAGVHTGEVETIDGKVGGITVVIGARIGALAEGGEVLVSSTVRDLTMGSGMRYEDRGEHPLKGIEGLWRLYAAKGSAPGS